MLSNFPIPHPDETLYSLVARYGDWLRYPSHKRLFREVFGAETGTATIEFPSRLAAFMSRLPVGHPCAGPSLLVEHTLLPWYSPFMPDDRVGRLRSAMLGDGGGAAPGLVGLQASRVRVPAFLRFCPECFREDHRDGHELYWRRLHQVTGIEACPRHAVWLADSPVPRLDRVTRHSFEVPADGLRDVEPVRVGRTGESLLRVARLGERLLLPEWPSLPLEVLHRNLHCLLAGAGYSFPRGRTIRARRLVEAVCEHYPHDFLRKLGGTSWIHRLIHSPRGVQSPIRWLAMLGFLGVELEALFDPGQREMIQAKEGPGCRNPVCPASGRATCFWRSEFSSDLDAEVDLFRCEACGRVVGRCPKSREGEWVRDYGALWRKRLAALWGDPGQSLRGLSRALRVDPLTAKRQALKVGLAFPRRGKRETTTRGLADMLRSRLDRVPSLRKRWLGARTKHPDLGTKALRQKHPALYASLYRLDREWLVANQPPRVPRAPGLSRVDWVKRDQRLSNDVIGTAEQLRKVPFRPRRVTATAVIRAAGAISWLPKLDKLPKTRKALRKLEEGRLRFARRRVEHLVAESVAEGRQLRAWQVQRKAGLRLELVDSPELRGVVDGALARLAVAAERN
jgi:hypothetical protein